MIEFWKSHEQVARANKITTRLQMEAPDLLPGKLTVFYFSEITLEPVRAFEHIAGAALIGILDRCSLEGEDVSAHSLRYVHGKSEVMKGRPKITSVLLAARQEPVSDPDWLVLLPEIWHRFQGLMPHRDI